MARKRKYWLTAHWPVHVPDEDGTDNPYVYLQEDHVAVMECMEEGDLVAVYEYRGGRPEIREGVVVPCREPGAQAVIFHGRVDKLYRNPDIDHREYADGTEIDWVCCARLKNVRRGGVGVHELNVILDKPAGNRFRNFGRRNSRLLEIDRRTFQQITRRGTGRGTLGGNESRSWFLTSLGSRASLCRQQLQSHQLVDAVSDSLRGLAKLAHRPVCCRAPPSRRLGARG